MPWKEASIMSQRLELVMLAQAGELPLKELCRRFKVSRKTAYKWIRRHRQGGERELLDRSRRPLHSPARCDSGVEQCIMKLRQTHPAWGPRKLRRRLEEQSRSSSTAKLVHVPAASTISRILKRNGLIHDAAWQQHTAYQRFEYPKPNDLWQMDFKGHFALVAASKNTGLGRCHPLCVLDDHSRYALGIRACNNEESGTVQTQLSELFRCYGLPAGMLMDNGSAWSKQTKLAIWLMRLGIRVLHGRIGHPQTQGKLERFNRTLKAEAIGCLSFATLTHAQKRFDDWRDVYNLQRPHEALDLATPASRYQPSLRPFPEQLPQIEYGPADKVHTVNGTGQIFHAKRRWMIGQAFVGLPVAVRPTLIHDLLAVYFCHQKVAEINLQKQNPR